MPVVKLYLHGCTAGIPPSVNTHERAPRGEVKGWSESSTRRNTRFLYAVDETRLTGHGIAGTLTLRDCPPTHSDWGKLVKAFLMRLQRLGLVRAHYVTEWQRRGVPHLHGVFFFPDGRPIEMAVLKSRIRDAWLAIAKPYGAGPRGQYLEHVSDPVGWFKYLSKHASRGLSHYQRSPENVPRGWEKTGKMWSKWGDWPLEPVVEFELDQHAFFAFRRVVRAWRRSDARTAGMRKRIASARRMLKCPDRNRSSCRGVSEWISRNDAALVMLSLAAQGHRVRKRALGADRHAEPPTESARTA